jgi:hypothetical protein
VTTERIDLPACIRSKPSLIRSSGSVGDEIVDVDLAFHVPVDDARHVGAAARTAERGALPDAPGHQLERACPDFLTGAGDADDDRHAPAAVAALEGLAHHVHIADALEAVVGAAAGELDQVRHEVALHFLRVHEVRHAELAGERLARGFTSTPMILSAPAMRAPWTDVQADPAEAEHDDVRAGLDLGGVDDGADSGGHTAADVADLVEGRVLADLRHAISAAPCSWRTSSSPCSGGAACRRARSGSCRRASRPCPASRGSPCRGWSCATGRTCTRGIRECRAG